MKVLKIIRLFPGQGKSRWLVQMRNGATSVMTASELVADLRGQPVQQHTPTSELKSLANPT